MRSFVHGLVAVLFLPWGAGANDPAPDALAEAGHFKRLRAVVEQRLKANPSDAQAHYYLSKVRASAGDFDGAIAAAGKAAALDPRSAEYRFQVGVAVGEKARKERSFGLARRLKREFESALAMDPMHVGARVALIQFHLQAPWIVGGSEKAARKLVPEVARLDPVRGYLEEARLAMHDKEFSRLEGLYLKALEAGPRNYSTLMTLAGFYLRDDQKKYEVAEKYARQALGVNPGRVSAYSQLASLYAFQARWEDLDKVLADAEMGVPDNCAPYYFAAATLARSGKDNARAERYLQKYLSCETELNGPTHAQARWQLGLVYEKMNRKSEAIREIETAVRMNPDLEPAKKDLKRLKG
jgi:tetratricopeptide (TPR) repeat protein